MAFYISPSFTFLFTSSMALPLLLHTQAVLFCFIDPSNVHACTIYIQSIGSLLPVSHKASLHPILKAKAILLMLVQLSPGLG